MTVPDEAIEFEKPVVRYKDGLKFVCHFEDGDKIFCSCTDDDNIFVFNKNDMTTELEEKLDNVIQNE